MTPAVAATIHTIKKTNLFKYNLKAGRQLLNQVIKSNLVIQTFWELQMGKYQSNN